MTDAEKLRRIATGLRGRDPSLFPGDDPLMLEESDAVSLRRIAGLLDAVPPETLEAIRDGTWKAVPVEPTLIMLTMGWLTKENYERLLSAAPKKPEGNI